MFYCTIDHLFVKLKFAIIFFLCGCVSNHQNFNVYKAEPFRSGDQFPLNGFYFLKDFSPTKYWDRPHGIYFFADGSLCAYTTNEISTIPESEFWSYPEEYLRTLDFVRNAGEPGHFTVKNDTLIIEFITWRGGFPQQGSNRFEGIMGNDSTFILNRQICRWCPIRIDGFRDNGVRSMRDIQYRFYPTDIRPDSSRLWIKKTRWYRKRVWNRR
jgi:hypothetical protein